MKINAILLASALLLGSHARAFAYWEWFLSGHAGAALSGSVLLLQNSSDATKADPISFAVPMPTAPAPTVTVPLNIALVTTAGSAVTAILGTSHGKGGWVKNCNVTGAMYVNTSTTATTSETGGNAYLPPGINGGGGLFDIPPGAQIISVNGDTNNMAICGESYN